MITEIVIVSRNSCGEKEKSRDGKSSEVGIKNTIISETTHLKLHRTNVCCHLSGIGSIEKKFVIHNVP